MSFSLEAFVSAAERADRMEMEELNEDEKEDDSGFLPPEELADRREM